jgi:aerobic-type carbon monoxide dehydrogenase small subunit (CoxS/CutS family)
MLSIPLFYLRGQAQVLRSGAVAGAPFRREEKLLNLRGDAKLKLSHGCLLNVEETRCPCIRPPNHSRSQKMNLKVNGLSHEVSVAPERSLLSVLRDDLNLTAAKYGCGEGECGACTVLLDGKAVRSCRIKAEGLANREITTVEGITRKDGLHPVQQAFLDADAMQCGYCICGMIMSAVALLGKQPHPTRAQVVEGMDGNICRCGAYPRILEAVLGAAKKQSGSPKKEAGHE